MVRKLWYPLVLLLLSLRVQAHVINWECPNEFQIRQEPSMRVFSILDNTQFLGAIVNSDYGQLDFYNSDKIKLGFNLLDCLYDSSNNLLGFIKWQVDPETKKWFWQRKHLFFTRKTHIILFSNIGTPIVTLDEEGEGGSFVFRDYDTQKPLAIALWSSSLLGSCFIAKFDISVQNWDVIIVDRPLLEERQILPIFLTWSLLKHSQLRFPSPSDFPYETHLFP